MMGSIKRVGIVSVVIISILIAGWVYYYSNYTFHITKTTPSTSDVATLTPSITISVNKEIKSIGDIISSPSVSYIESYTFNEKEIKISLLDLPAEEKITITLNDIQSVDGYSFNSTLSFTPALKDATDLPEAQYKELLEKQDRNTAGSADPIQAVVPYSTNNYALSLTLTGKGDLGNNVFEISARIILSAADVRINRDEAINKYKNEINSYLSSNDIDISQYSIMYTIEEPSLY